MFLKTSSLVIFSALLIPNLFLNQALAAEKKTAKKSAMDQGKSNTDQTLKVDPAASHVQWEGKKIGGKHHGEIKIKGGEIQVKGGTVVGGQIEIDMTTLTDHDLTDKEYNAKLVNHLKSDDFFSVAKYPTSTFKITAVKALTGTSDATHEVTGDLTIKGITNPVTFPAKITNKGGKWEGNAMVQVDRTKYDIRFRSVKFFSDLGDKVIDDNFTLTLKIVAQ